MSMQGTGRILHNIIRRVALGVIGAALLAILPAVAQADTVPYVQPTQATYTAPYTSHPCCFTVPPSDSIMGEYGLLVSAYQSYFNASSCGFPINIYPTPGSDGAVAQVTYTSPCGGGNQIFATVGPGKPGHCPDGGYTPDQPPPDTTTCSRPDVSITPGEVVIPSGSTVDDNDDVLTSSILTLMITKDGQPDPGISVTLQSDRGALDDISLFGSTDVFGNPTVPVSTRSQPGPSTITSLTPDVNTLQPGVVTWLPARYEDTFEVTCYAVAQEAQDIDGQMVNISGIPGVHHQGFLTDTDEQGSGLLLQGGYMQRDWHKPNGNYRINACPIAKDGSCAQKGETAAVDASIIPLGSDFSIDTVVGTRVAHDGGGGINVDHIDVYFGPTAQDYSDCKVFGDTDGHVVKFIDYGN